MSTSIDQTPVIEARNLGKLYGNTVAVDGINLVINSGEIFGILGPNGAGKTTTLEMIEGLRSPDSGTIRLAGHIDYADDPAVRRKIGVQLQTTALFDYLTAAELIELFAGLYNVDASPARIDQLLAMVGLQDKHNARAEELSGGQRQRLSIAISLVNEPEVVFLDEPTTGLDPAARRELWQTIRSIRDGGATVVLTTHYMEEAEMLCDRVAIMDGGRIIACDTPTGLIRQVGPHATVRARMGSAGLSESVLVQLPGVVEAQLNGDRVTLRTRQAQDTLIQLLQLARENDVTLDDLHIAAASLEDVFLQLAGHTYSGDSDTEEGGDTTQEQKRSRWSRRKRA